MPHNFQPPPVPPCLLSIYSYTVTIEEGFIKKPGQTVVVAFWGKMATYMLLLRLCVADKLLKGRQGQNCGEIPSAALDLAPQTETTTVCLVFCINPSSMIYKYQHLEPAE